MAVRLSRTHPSRFAVVSSFSRRELLMIWTIDCSYYIRSGTQDMEDALGILVFLDKQWAKYRGNKSSAALKQMAAATFASSADNQDAGQ
ncbi:hypothetical protein V1509DRAFT_165426 [Lipomyces kononenkoae]